MPKAFKWKSEYHPAVVAKWVYERLQIQVAESHRSQVQIPLGTMKISNCPGLFYGGTLVAAREIGYETL